MRVILDTDVLVAALRSRSGASNALLLALADGGIEVAVSVPIMLEYEAERVAAEEGTTLNQLINVALAEKLAALRTERYFRERAGRGEVETFKEILRQAAAAPPRPGDEIRHHPPVKTRARR